MPQLTWVQSLAWNTELQGLVSPCAPPSLANVLVIKNPKLIKLQKHEKAKKENGKRRKKRNAIVAYYVIVVNYRQRRG